MIPEVMWRECLKLFLAEHIRELLSVVGDVKGVLHGYLYTVDADFVTHHQELISFFQGWGIYRVTYYYTQLVTTDVRAVLKGDCLSDLVYSRIIVNQPLIAKIEVSVA